MMKNGFKIVIGLCFVLLDLLFLGRYNEGFHINAVLKVIV